MQPGNMDQMIVIQQRTELPDGAGGVTRVWSKKAQVWASVRAKAVREALEGGKVNASYIAIFTIYSPRDISEVDRIVWNGELYNIRGIMRSSTRDQRLVIEAERGTAN